MAVKDLAGGGFVGRLSLLPVGTPDWVARGLQAAQSLAEEFGFHLVGGSARDLIAGRPLSDLDLLVSGELEPAAKALAQTVGIAPEEIKYSPFLTARLGGIDLARARRERYRQAAALPEVAPADLKEDLGRRDYSVNALAIALADQSVLDLYAGQRDLRRGLLRIIKKNSFWEDPTRIVRGARIGGRLGLVWEQDTGRAAVQNGRLLRELSPDRLGREIDLLWQETNCPACLELLEAVGALAMIWPKRTTVKADATRALRACRLLGIKGHDRSRAVRAVIFDDNALLAFPDADREISAYLLNISPRLRQADDADLVDLLDAVPLWGLGFLLAKEPSLRRVILRYRFAVRRVQSALRGQDLLALGYAPGPAVGRVLRALRHERLRGNITNRLEEIEWALAYLRGGA
jgi:tRNA nucleotidyltransferase (CCA-adding enzyme)